MLHLDGIIELCPSLVRSEAKQNARLCVDQAAEASRYSGRTTFPSQGVGGKLGWAPSPGSQQECTSQKAALTL